MDGEQVVFYRRRDVSEAVMLELAKLSNGLLGLQGSTLGQLQILATNLSDLRTDIAQLRSTVMALTDKIDQLNIKVVNLEAEQQEIVAFIGKAGQELAAAKLENAALLARIADMEPNQITQADRDAIDAAGARIDAVANALNTFTPGQPVPEIPPAGETPPVEEPPVEEPPVEPQL